MKEIGVRATFLEEVLGSLPGNRDVYRDFIASKAPSQEIADDEVEQMDASTMEEKGTTVFLKDDAGHPYLYDYQVKGFFKEAMGMLRMCKGTKCEQVKSYKKKIDGLVFVYDRKIPILNPMGGQIRKDQIGICQRPLRGQTAQGERISLACSETVPAGSHVDFTIKILDDSLEDAIRECLDYGELKGFLQWRNSGKGRFKWEEV